MKLFHIPFYLLHVMLKEFQLTDTIQNLIENKKKVLAITLNKNEEEVDVGTVESYKNAQHITFRKA